MRLPHRAAPARVERAHHLLAAIRRRPRSQPERIRDSGFPQNSYVRSAMLHLRVQPPLPAPRACLRPPRPPLPGRRSRNRRRHNISDSPCAPWRDPPTIATVVQFHSERVLQQAGQPRLPQRRNHHVAREFEFRVRDRHRLSAVRLHPARPDPSARTSPPPRARRRSIISTGCASQWNCTPSTLE